MKRAISVLLVVLLVIASTLLLVACNGGIKSADDWGSAIDYYKTCDAVTIKIEDNNLHMNYIHDKERLKSNLEVSFNAEKGMVFVSMDCSRHDFWGTKVSGSTYEKYYVQDGVKVYCYSRRLSEHTTEDWTVDNATLFDSEEDAASFLREQYLHPVDVDGNEFPSLLELNYAEFSAKMFGKFERKNSDNRFNYTYVVNFSKGKPTKYTYQHKAHGGNVDDTRKFSMTIKYSADISLPTDVPDVN